jgi:imidazolonepropionase-like amidohydrolase
MGVFPGESVESLRGRYYFIIDNVADLDREWPAILGARPDFIKAFLFHSEEYTQRRDIDVPRGYKALNPELAPEIVRRAHAAGLRVVFHAHTAEDLHVALEAGADQIAHVPGLADPQPLREDDLALAARRRTPMHTTISAISRVPTADENAARRRRELIVETLGLAQRLGVNLVVGSDAEGATSRIEVAELRRLGIFSNVELLAMWGERCAQAVFPQRKVGRLAEDYEASFLVLQGDPLADFDNTGRISRAMKDGHWLKPSTTPLR